MWASGARQGDRVPHLRRLRLPAALEPRGARPAGRTSTRSTATTRTCRSVGPGIDGRRARASSARTSRVGRAGGYINGQHRDPRRSARSTTFVIGRSSRRDVAAVPQLEALRGAQRSGTHAQGINGGNSAYIGQSLLPSHVTTPTSSTARRSTSTSSKPGAASTTTCTSAPRTASRRCTGPTWQQDETENHVGLFVHDEVKIGRRFAVVGDYRADYVPYLNSHRAVAARRRSSFTRASSRPSAASSPPRSGRRPSSSRTSASRSSSRSPAARSAPRAVARTTRFKVQPGADLHDGARVPELGERLLHVRHRVLLQPRQQPDRARAQPRRSRVGDLANPGVPHGARARRPGLYPLFFGGFENQCQTYNVYGAELGVRTFPVEGLDFYANYTLMDVEQDNAQCSPRSSRSSRPTRGRARTRSTPASRSVPRSASMASVDFHYVSPQDWAEQVSDIQKQQHRRTSRSTSTRTRSSTRSVGYRFLQEPGRGQRRRVQHARRPAPRAPVRAGHRPPRHGLFHLQVLRAYDHANPPLLAPRSLFRRRRRVRLGAERSRGAPGGA